MFRDSIQKKKKNLLFPKTLRHNWNVILPKDALVICKSSIIFGTINLLGYEVVIEYSALQLLILHSLFGIFILLHSSSIE